MESSGVLLLPPLIWNWILDQSWSEATIRAMGSSPARLLEAKPWADRPELGADGPHIIPWGSAESGTGTIPAADADTDACPTRCC